MLVFHDIHKKLAQNSAIRNYTTLMGTMLGATNGRTTVGGETTAFASREGSTFSLISSAISRNST